VTCEFRLKGAIRLQPIRNNRLNRASRWSSVLSAALVVISVCGIGYFLSSRSAGPGPAAFSEPSDASASLIVSPKSVPVRALEKMPLQSRGQSTGVSVPRTPSRSQPQRLGTGPAFAFSFFGQLTPDLERVTERTGLLPTDLGGACSSEQLLKAADVVSEETLINSGRQRFGQGLFLKEWTQFWKQGEKFGQIRLIWEMDDPPTYRIEAYVSPDAQLRSAARDESFFAWLDGRGMVHTAGYPLDALFRTVRSYLKLNVAQGALFGTRFARVVSDRHTDDFQEVVLEDNRVVELRTQELSCAASARMQQVQEPEAVAGGKGGREWDLRLICGCQIDRGATRPSSDASGPEIPAGGMP
jgi:hypothetical protein